MLIVRSRAPEHRVAGGRHLVQYYHERLRAYGVASYPWEACWQDYRLGVVEYLHFPLRYRNEPGIKPYVEAMMEMLDAVGGAELLG